MVKVRVVLADDHPVTRAGIRKFLDKDPDIEVVAEAETGEDTLRLVQEHHPDVLLLDMELPGIKGVDVARQLRESGSAVRILALSSYDDKQYIFGLLAAGASGYLIKEEIAQTIVEAVRGVARGEQGWVSRRVAAIMANWTRQGENEGRGLTDRETQVLRWVSKGKTNQEIGVELGISEKTVEKHLESVFSKLRVASRVEAAVLAVREGLV
jgi:DNA-binding NarL/FixJ family response regulator